MAAGAGRGARGGVLSLPVVGARGAARAVETVACLLCGRDDARPVRVSADRLAAARGPAGDGVERTRRLGAPRRRRQPATFTVVRCPGCGLAYVNPRPTPAEIGTLLPRRLPHRARRRRRRAAPRERLAAAPVRRGRRLARRPAARRAAACSTWAAAPASCSKRCAPTAGGERRRALGARRRGRPPAARTRRADRRVRRRRASRRAPTRRSSSRPPSSTCTTRWRR